MTHRKCNFGLGESPVHPWYKERLRTKYLKDPIKKQQLCGALDGRGWRFLNSGQDDFRDGYPASRGEAFTQPQRRTGPPVFGLENQTRPASSPQKRFTKEQMCFSKMNCLRQSRRQYVETVEQKLKAHPLALYPHLASGLQPDLFDDVLSVLDPEMHFRREADLICFTKKEKCSEENAETCKGQTQEPVKQETTSKNTISMKEEVKGFKSRNPYKWQEVKDAGVKEDQMVSDNCLRSPLQDEDIKQVTKLFCDWVTSLGEDNSSLTESTVLNLFFSGYEKKPSLPFPNQVLGQNQTPEQSHAIVDSVCKDYSNTTQMKISELNTVYTSSVKPAYGVWYLDPKTWKNRPASKSPIDPSVTEDLEFEQQPTEKDEELKKIHATQAFRQFIISKGLRMPRFLNSLFLEEKQENRTRGTDAPASVSTRKGTGIP